MKRITIIMVALLLILLLAACTLPDEPQTAPATQDAGEEAVEVDVEAELDYCDLPGGTRVTWFDLSTFIFIPQSSYQMGFDLLEAEFDFEPAHPVSLGAFWMHETEVTNRQYANCVAASQCAAPEKFPDLPYWFAETDRLDEPVVGVTWQQADAYCQWIGTRLPTEAEWELAARGVTSEPYPWGTDQPDCEHANYQGCLDPEDPQPVHAGKLLEGISPFEMFDMAGNVNEWVHDWYGEDYYQNSPSANPPGPETGEFRVWRGGGYDSSAEGLFSYLRDLLEPDQAQPDLGFRCAWSCGEEVPPQLCQLPPVVGHPNPPIGDPKPSGKPNIIGEGYCEWRGGVQSSGVVLTSPDGTDLSQYDFSNPDGPITCTLLAGNLVVCHGAAVQPKGDVTITVCPDCQPGYYFVQQEGVCEPMAQLDPRGFGIIDHGDATEEAGSVIPLSLADVCPPGSMEVDGQCVIGLTIGCPPGTVEVDGQCVIGLTTVCPPGSVEVDGQCLTGLTTVCPPGSVEVDGQCLTGLTTVCPPGSVEVDGQCVTGLTTVCPPGSVEVDGQCVTGLTTVCPPGSVEVDGQCVTELTVVCPPGTVEVDGQCVLDLVAECPPGTVEINGSCWPAGLPNFELPTCAPFYYETESCGCIPNHTICLADVLGSTRQPIESGDPEDSSSIGMEVLGWLPHFPLSPDDIGSNPDATPVPENCGGLESMVTCPPAYFPYYQDSCWTCVPLGLTTDCPSGYLYDPESRCCISQAPVLTCPAWTYFDPITQSCLPIIFERQSCFEITISVPACGPQPSPTPRAGCSNPSQYTTQQSCEAAKCRWVFMATIPSYCALP